MKNARKSSRLLDRIRYGQDTDLMTSLTFTVQVLNASQLMRLVTETSASSF